ncbi:hypothetical protein DO66_6109 [Burkholderia pseudomallei]|nr:hypothetical protein DO66_6109 [Burkholderia pseudomallei]
MPANFSTRKPNANVCASAVSPATAQVSQITSPSHIAARNGNTSRTPLVSTRATSAATLGPGEPAATSRAAAKRARLDSDMLKLPRRCDDDRFVNDRL